MTSPVCDRCGAYMVLHGEDAMCSVCEGVEYTVEQAHALLDRILYYWMYGYGNLSELQHDTEVWCRVAGPLK